MTIALTILHILVSIFMIAVVLLQSGKGAEMGASFGSGGSQSVFGAGGGTTFLSKMTTGAAVIFMLTSLTLAYISGQPSSSSIMSGKGKSAVTTKVPTQMPQPSAPAQQSNPTTMPTVPAAPVQQHK
ncbi:preprotein translocase subunit SecG [Geobacter sp. AOG2]|uniref:preprotein translocase subunit SecG n=1 Tax=Geobacter sp. AOG2 TaxID=1566347 RepID=UPI001CC52963|nr:preprotein translocase subunit SecG [Geobacter sp. AOG2]GFE60881.1 preprotein translocase subunit SecG [Geobacter sp. AOG2]